MSNAIPLYHLFLDIIVKHSEQTIAAMIVKEAVRLGLDPYTVKTERKGDYLYIK